MTVLIVSADRSVFGQAGRILSRQALDLPQASWCIGRSGGGRRTLLSWPGQERRERQALVLYSAVLWAKPDVDTRIVAHGQPVFLGLPDHGSRYE